MFARAVIVVVLVTNGVRISAGALLFFGHEIQDVPNMNQVPSILIRLLYLSAK